MRGNGVSLEQVPRRLAWGKLTGAIVSQRTLGYLLRIRRIQISKTCDSPPDRYA